LQLNGGCSFLETKLIGIGYGYTVSFFVKPMEENAANAILFGSKDAVITLNQQGIDKLGFSREGYHYVFDYKVPIDQWTHIVIEGNNKGTSLYVNGTLKEKLEGAMKNFPNGKNMTIVQTLFFPLQFIGDSTNAANVFIRDLKVFNKVLSDETVSKIDVTDTTQ
jgi:hexosaminidase